MATTITKSVSVKDVCKGIGSSTKTCSAVVSGDTDYVDNYSVEGTSGGTPCCSDTTSLCLNAWIGCPLVFDTITWKETIIEDGVTYTLKSATSGGSTSLATYEQSATKLTEPTLEEGQNTYDRYEINITNPNDVTCQFYSQDLSEYGGSVDIEAGATYSLTLTWGTTESSHTAKGYFSANGYKDSENDTLTITRPAETTYTLTVNYYVSNVPSGTKYYEIGGSQLVKISDYKISVDNASYSTSDPSEDFGMNNKNQTLNMYYIGKLTAPILEEKNKDFNQYTIDVTNPNDVTCDFYSKELIDDYGGSVTIEAGATFEMELTWGSGSTSHVVSGYLGASGYNNSNMQTITVERPTISSLFNPILSIESETTNDFVLRVRNSNEVVIKWYWGYSSNPTTYAGTISADSTDTLTITKTTNKTIFVKFIYEDLSSQNSTSVPYIEETTQLSRPIITLNSEKTTSNVYYYSIKNENAVEVSVYINGVVQSKYLEGGSETEYHGSWASGQTSITITSQFGTLSSSYSDSLTSSLTISRPKIKLPQPSLNILTNTYNSYSFTYTNSSSQYSVQPFFNGSTQGDILGPSQSRDYEFDWGTGETSKSFYAYAMPTDTSRFTSSDSVVLTITRPKTLSQPEITDIVQNDGSVTLTIKNSNDTAVLWLVDNVQQSGSIYEYSTDTYTYTWGDTETSKTFEIKFKDPTGQYGDSNILSKTISKEIPTLTDPILSSVVSQTGYSITITNKNQQTVTYYVDGVEKTTIAYNASETFSAEWATSETTKTINVLFTADGYESSSKSITVNKPGVITVSAPNLSLVENTTKAYKIRISNPNTTTGTYYLVDSNHARIDDIKLTQGGTYDYSKEWGSEETSKTFTCALLLIVENEVDPSNPIYIYSDTATLETFNKPINVLEKPILSENVNNYTTSKFNVKNTNNLAVTWLVNYSQQSTVIAKDTTATFSYDWQENEKTKRFTVRFTAENYDASESYIDLIRPNQLVEPIVELLVNNHDSYAIRIKNKNEVSVSLYEETSGDTSKTLSAKGQVIIKGAWENETTKTLNYYFVASDYGQSKAVSITFARLNEGDYYVLYLNIDGEVYKIGEKYSVATQSLDGLMSSADKVKLDNINIGLYLKKSENYAYGINTFTIENDYVKSMTLKSRDTGSISTIYFGGNSTNVVDLISAQSISGVKTFTNEIKTNQIANENNNAMVRYKPAENKVVLGGSTIPTTIMGNGDRPNYSKDGSDFTGSPLALLSDISSYTVGDGIKIENNVISVDTDYIAKQIKILSIKIGDLITMDLGDTASSYGTLHQYRVLKISGSIVEVVAMYEPTTSQTFGSSQAYSGSALDTYLNTTWYNTLSDKAKAAIVDNEITQYKYSYGSVSDSHRSYATYSSKAVYASGLSRHIYALDVEDIEMYFGGTGGSASANTQGTFTIADLMTLFYKSTTTISSKYFWLRSAISDYTSGAWYVDGGNGYVSDYDFSDAGAVRPAFKIDLSKIDWSISN